MKVRTVVTINGLVRSVVVGGHGWVAVLHVGRTGSVSTGLYREGRPARSKWWRHSRRARQVGK